MSRRSAPPARTDVLVAGSGAAGLTAAIAAAAGGARVVLAECAGQLGGTTALSFGRVWVPASHHAPADTREAARAYLSRAVQRALPGDGQRVHRRRARDGAVRRAPLAASLRALRQLPRLPPAAAGRGPGRARPRHHPGPPRRAGPAGALGTDAAGLPPAHPRRVGGVAVPAGVRLGAARPAPRRRHPGGRRRAGGRAAGRGGPPRRPGAHRDPADRAPPVPRPGDRRDGGARGHPPGYRRVGRDPRHRRVRPRPGAARPAAAGRGGGDRSGARQHRGRPAHRGRGRGAAGEHRPGLVDADDRGPGGVGRGPAVLPVGDP